MYHIFMASSPKCQYVIVMLGGQAGVSDHTLRWCSGRLRVGYVGILWMICGVRVKGEYLEERVVRERVRRERERDRC